MGEIGFLSSSHSDFLMKAIGRVWERQSFEAKKQGLVNYVGTYYRENRDSYQEFAFA